MNIVSMLRPHIINFRGEKSPKIVVIESDDWGSLRMPSKKVYDSLVNKGFDFSDQPYERVDSIATEDDLTALFQVLSNYKDSRGNHPIVTAVSVTANPSFEKIKESEFEKYYYEPLNETLCKYSKSNNSIITLWEEGIENRIFYPQFHGREHINVPLWMRNLKRQKNDNRLVFDYGIPGFFERETPHLGNPYARAFRFYNKEDLEFIIESVKDGLRLFECLWGYKSLSMMAPAYTWNDDVEITAKECGVNYIQTAFYQNRTGTDGNKVVHHYFGQRNNFGQRYLLRNCNFEPIQNNYSKATVDRCLKEISVAFMHHRPATISSHRLNYVGRIDETNRDRSLKLLDLLIRGIIKRWPDVVFMDSSSVGELILNQ